MKSVIALLLASALIAHFMAGGRAFAEESASNGTVLTYELKEIPTDGKFAIPRQYGRLKDVRWQGQTEELKLTPYREEWVIQLGLPPNGVRVLVVMLLDHVEGDVASLTHLKLSAKSPTEFPAHLAETHGEKLVFEPQPHKNTIGYWTVPTDWASWTIAAAQPGLYDVDILQGCGTDQGGSNVRILLTSHGKQVDELTFAVEDTGHFQNFKQRRIGQLRVPADGAYQLEIRPKNIANKAVMDVRKVILTPAGE